MKKLLLVIDYQNDFVSGSLGFEQAVSLEDPICRKIESYLKNGDDIIFTLDTHGQDYSSTQEGKKLPVPHCLKGSDGWKVYGKAASYLSKAAAVFEKPTFGSLELGEYLKRPSLRVHRALRRGIQYLCNFQRGFGQGRFTGGRYCGRFPLYGKQ